MACLIAPMAEAIITTVVKKVVEKKEKESEVKGIAKVGISWSRKLGWLNKMLWGGVLMLTYEHVWHGEIVPWPPFLTAMNNPADVGPMLHEILTVGTAMSMFVTVVWAIIVLIADKKAKEIKDNVKAEA